MNAHPVHVAWLAIMAVACTPGENASPDAGALPTLTVVTFNTGSGAGGSTTHDGGFGPAQGALSDEHYGNGLAFNTVIAEARRFMDAVNPDLVFIQEVFHAPDCALVPAEAREGFTCQSWMPGDETVVQQVVGPAYQVACHDGKPDKCVAVKRTTGTLRGCDAGYCLDALVGAPVTGCGGGTRVGRGVVDLAGGGSITVVNVHGSSGITAEDMECRRRQFQRLFVDHGLGDGPAANGTRNIIAGDFNTDPGRFFSDDVSAAEIIRHVGRNLRFDFVTEASERATPTYLGLVNIDHVISDAFTGTCVAHGITPGTTHVSAPGHFDHVPVACVLRAR